jgi:membrane-bound lytic murein transglycosylase B
VSRGLHIHALIGLALVGVVASPVVAQVQGVAPASAVRTPDTRPTFATWLETLRAEALERGVKPEIVKEALDGLEPLPIVIERDRTQAERVLSIDRYLARLLTRKLVRSAREAYDGHRPILNRVESAYGVPGSVVVAVWGLESNFGRFSGIRPVVAALATLAYDPRRAAFFRAELFDALAILQRGDIDLANFQGSWAGAMGQAQFMPSSYLKYAQDFDGDGRRDIWHSTPDVLASIANYLKEFGWNPRERWGRPVRIRHEDSPRIAQAVPLRTSGCEAYRQMSEARALAEWVRLGVRAADGHALPAGDMQASLLRAGRVDYLVYRNYEALLGYNCAHAYALAVAQLAERTVSR